MGRRLEIVITWGSYLLDHYHSTGGKAAVARRAREKRRPVAATEIMNAGLYMVRSSVILHTVGEEDAETVGLC